MHSPGTVWSIPRPPHATGWLKSVQMPLDPAYVSKLDAREKETDSRDVILGGIKCGSDSQQSTGNREGVTEHQDADAVQ